MATIICYPHQISVGQDGKVVATIMRRSSVADVGYGHVFGTGPGEAVKGSGHCEGSMYVGLGPFCVRSGHPHRSLPC